MYCTNCGKKLGREEKFCSKCGEEKEQEIINDCPKCKKKLNQELNFCANCGYKYKETVDANKITTTARKQILSTSTTKTVFIVVAIIVAIQMAISLFSVLIKIILG